jgi:hypothetical protein
MIPKEFSSTLSAGTGGSQFAAINKETLLQTGGIELGNMNVANKFVYDATSASMKPIINGLNDESMKYLNTLRKVGVDDQTAYSYLRNNGVGLDGVLDKSLSADFIMEEGKKKGYAFTGDNLKNSFKAADYNYNMRFTKPKVEGDVFAQPDSLLKPQGTTKSKDYASAALNAALSGQNEDPNGAVKFASLQATDPNSMISGTGGSAGAYTKEGALLTKAQLAFFANQNLDIA